VLACDCNTNPDAPSEPFFPGAYQAYLLLKNAGFVDAFRTTRPTDPGFTFGQAEDLLNVTSTMSHRIDLVQFRGAFTVKDVQVVGAGPADRARVGLWPSDHARVVATLTLPICRAPGARHTTSSAASLRNLRYIMSHRSNPQSLNLR
jgi:hypothetical protein